MKIFWQTLFNEFGKNIETRRIFGRFSYIFRKTCIFLFIIEVRSTKNINWIFSPICTKIFKNVKFITFYFRFFNKISIFFYSIWVTFKSAFSWPFFISKSTILGWFTVNHLHFINEISFKMPQNLPF